MVFIKVYKSPVANANRTLKKPVDVDWLISKLTDEYLISQLVKYRGQENIYLWDLGKKATEEITKESLLAIVCSDKIYCGRVAQIIPDKKGSIGDIVGWGRNFTKPWENVTILKELRTFPTNEKINLFVKGYDSSFYELRGETEKFFFELLGKNLTLSHAITSTVHESRIYTPDWLKSLISDIQCAREDPKHSERVHESIVEKFFEALGYERIKEIKFQVGRIDITISVEGSPLIVIEVKKYWNLNIHKDSDAVEQAYKYAQKNGAKYVIVSNGDYYAIYNRDMGRSYVNNLQGEFTLTKLTENDIQLVDTLRRENILL
jgi:hypothetical protein